MTVCCHQRGKNQLCFPSKAEAIFRSAQILHDKEEWQLRLMLLMPDHLHALVSVSGDVSLGKTVGRFKRATANFASVDWQKNFFDHRLRSEKTAAAKYDYIRHNPVRAGLVAAPDDWPYRLELYA